MQNALILNSICEKLQGLIPWMRLVILWLCFFQHEKEDLILELLALRQQVLRLQRTHPRPRLTRANQLGMPLLKRKVADESFSVRWLLSKTTWTWRF